MALLDCLVSQNEQRKISNNPFRIMLPLVRYSWLPSVRVKHLNASHESGTASACTAESHLPRSLSQALHRMYSGFSARDATPSKGTADFE